MVTKSTKGLPSEGATMKQTQKNVEFAKGGDTPMFGKGDRTITDTQEAAGTKAPGSTNMGEQTNPGEKFAKGGSGKMFGYAGSQPAQGGITSAR